MVAGTGDEKTGAALPEMKTESENGVVAVESMVNVSNSDTVVTGAAESGGDAQPATSEKSALPAGVPVLSIGILFLVFFVLRKKD